ncbi:hypothetical protein ABPG72_013861 [Tetrahymena utriculariae]
MDQKVFQELIKPFEQHFNEAYNRYFYYNPITSQSLWELPSEILEKLKIFEKTYKQEKQKDTTSNDASSIENKKGDVNNSKESELDDQKLIEMVKMQIQREKLRKNEDDQDEEEQTIQDQQGEKQNRSRSQSNIQEASYEDNQEVVENNEQMSGQQKNIEDNLNTLDKYIPKGLQQQISKRGEKDISKILLRPSRKQIEQSLADKYAYKEGDQEYNIWYGKHLSDTRDTVRDHKTPAETRCNTELDSGYTKADLTDRYSAYYCHHWAKGCCSEGQNCRYFHRVPSLAECMTIDNSRDVFGRQRHDKHREDRGGVGSFMYETRSIEIKDFKAPTEGIGVITQMYEILYRHFSEWGDIEDIKYLPNQGRAIIRYVHRCMAEYAKEAMQHQALDEGEVINIKWFLEHLDTENQEKYNKEHYDKLKRVVEKQKRDQEIKQKAEEANLKKQQHLLKRQQYLAQKKFNQEQQLMKENVQLLNQVFADDDDEDDNGEGDQYSGYEESKSRSRSRSRSRSKDRKQKESKGREGDDKEIKEKSGQEIQYPLISQYPQYGQYTQQQQQEFAAYYQQQYQNQSMYYQQYYQYSQQNQDTEKPLQFNKKK